MYLLELIPGDKTDPALVGAPAGVRRTASRQGRGGQRRPTQLRGQPHRHVLDRVCDQRDGQVRPHHRGGRRGQRPGPGPLGDGHLRHLQPGRDRRARLRSRQPLRDCRRRRDARPVAAAAVDPGHGEAKGYLGEKTGGSFFREKRTLVHRPRHPRIPALAESAAGEPGRGQQAVRPGGPGEEVHLIRRHRGAGSGGTCWRRPSCTRPTASPRSRRHRPDRPGHALGLRLGPRPLRAVGRPGRQRDGRAHAG